MGETLGAKIRRLRTSKGITQAELASLLGYSSRSAINKIESDVNMISYDKLLKLVKIFDIEINDLINGLNYNEKVYNKDEGDKMYTKELLNFIYNSPAAYNAIETIKKALIDEGFIELNESETYKIEKGCNYFVTRNGTSIIAFKIPENIDKYGFNIVASHSDSPSYKIKPNNDIKSGLYHKLSVEPYGGMIHSTWFDRPLSLAGRVIIKQDGAILTKEVNIDRPLLSITNVPIHMNRNINDGYRYDAAVDMQPLLTQELDKFDLKEVLAQELNLSKEDILNFDLYLCLKEKGYIWGLNNEYFSSTRIDDLQCAFTSLKGFIKGKNSRNINVYACFDNEEVGSATRQGADSSFLDETLKRVNSALGFNESRLLEAISSSFMVSADNAHALHPNHPELFDGLNHVYLNKGIVIKNNASQSYASDGLSSAIFVEILNKCHVPYQFYTNKANIRGGSTLGNISNTHVSILSIDIGLPQLAMHSINETAGVKDNEYAIRAFETFYSTIIIKEKEKYILK